MIHNSTSKEVLFYLKIDNFRLLELTMTVLLTRIKSPFIFRLDSPFISMLDSPFISILDFPFIAMLDSPFTSMMDSPFISRLDSPFISMLDSPFISRLDSLCLSRLDTPFIPRLRSPLGLGCNLPFLQFQFSLYLQIELSSFGLLPLILGQYLLIFIGFDLVIFPGLFSLYCLFPEIVLWMFSHSKSWTNRWLNLGFPSVSCSREEMFNLSCSIYTYIYIYPSIPV